MVAGWITNISAAADDLSVSACSTQSSRMPCPLNTWASMQILERLYNECTESFPGNADDLPSYLVERAKIRLRYEKDLYFWFAKPFLRLWIDPVMLKRQIAKGHLP
jgi:hypothetical protein